MWTKQGMASTTAAKVYETPFWPPTHLSAHEQTLSTPSHAFLLSSTCIVYRQMAANNQRLAQPFIILCNSLRTKVGSHVCKTRGQEGN
jgi:hypothetical protein